MKNTGVNGQIIPVMAGPMSNPGASMLNQMPQTAQMDTNCRSASSESSEGSSTTSSRVTHCAPKKHEKRTPPGFNKVQKLQSYSQIASKPQKPQTEAFATKERKQQSRKLRRETTHPATRPERRPKQGKTASRPKKTTPKKKKYAYRSKQNKIDTVLKVLLTKYADILAPEEEVLRGEDVLRLHCKKFEALNIIEEVLMKAEVEKGIEFCRISFPLSMKNAFQKKGFLVYIKTHDTDELACLMEHCRTYSQFSKCTVARPAERKDEEPFAKNTIMEEECPSHVHDVAPATCVGMVRVSEPVAARNEFKSDPAKAQDPFDDYFDLDLHLAPVAFEKLTSQEGS